MNKKYLIIGLIVLVIVLSLFVIIGLGKKSIIGSWSAKDAVGYIYKFNKDKTGSYTEGGFEKPFTYEDDGSKVSILYKNQTFPLELGYSIKGKELTIKDEYGNDIVYVKK